MATALASRPATTGADPHEHGTRTPRRRALELPLVLVAVGFTLIVGLEGDPVWRLVRVAIVLGVVALAWLAATWWSTIGAAIVAIVVGLAAGPIGITIGWSYLTTTGLSRRAVGGLLAGAGGLALLVVGVLTLLGGAPRWAKVLAVPAFVVVAYVAVLPLVIAVYATNVPRPEVGTATPADRGLEYVDASFVTSDGVTLSGWYVPSRNGAAVALLHGSSSTRSSVLDQAVVLARHGYGVLLFDARGHGRSGGQAMDFGWYGDEDLGAAVSYLASRSDVDPARIGAVGMSMGGEEAVGAMAGDSRLRAVVGEGVTNRVAADKGWLSGAYGVRGWLTEQADRATYALADVLTDADPPGSLRDAVRAAAPRPVLLIAAGEVADEAKADASIQSASPDTVEVWIVPGSGHTGGLHTQPAEWESRVTSFLDTALG